MSIRDFSVFHSVKIGWLELTNSNNHRRKTSGTLEQRLKERSRQFPEGCHMSWC
jgi:hypothetical protein